MSKSANSTTNNSPRIQLDYYNQDLCDEIADRYNKDGISGLPDHVSVIIADEGTIVARKGLFSPAPVYYCLWENQLFVDFNLKRVMDLYPGELTANHEKIKGYLSFSNELGPTDNLTFYNNIFRLLPGETLVFRNGCNLEFSVYCSEGFNYQCEDRAEHVKDIRERLNLSVRNLVSGRKKIAANLSGGLDSSTICGLAQSIREDRVLCVHYETETPEMNEYNYAQNVSEKHNSPLYRLYLKKEDILTSTRQIIDLTGRPESSNLPSSVEMALFRVCREHEADLLLSGLLGDQMIDYGFEYFNELADSGQWLKLKIVLLDYLHDSRTVQKVVLKQALQNLRQKPTPRRLLRLWGVMHDELGYSHIAIGKGWYNLISKVIFPKRSDRLERLYSSLITCGQPETKSRKVLKVDELLGIPLYKHQKVKLNNVYQHIIVEVMEQHYQVFKSGDIRVGYPFLDKGLLEVALQSKNEWKITGDLNRSILRDAMRDILPDEVYKRKSKGVFSRFLVNSFTDFYECFRKQCGENYKSNRIWEYCDKAVFETLVEIVPREHPNNPLITRIVLLLYRLLYLGIWFDYIEDLQGKRKEV